LLTQAVLGGLLVGAYVFSWLDPAKSGLAINAWICTSCAAHTTNLSDFFGIDSPLRFRHEHCWLCWHDIQSNSRIRQLSINRRNRNGRPTELERLLAMEPRFDSRCG